MNSISRNLTINQSIFSNDIDDVRPSVNYDKTSDAYDVKFIRTVHFLRFVLACLACLPNTFVIYICISRSALRTKVNYMVCNLMAANLAVCATNGVYDYLKYRNPECPNSSAVCTAITWSLIMAGHAVVWGIILAITARTLQYGGQCEYWNKVMTAFRLFELRFAHFLIDAVVACFVLEEIGALANETACTYQLMIIRSDVYFYYGLFLTLAVVSCVACALAYRTTIRRKRMKQRRKLFAVQSVLVNSSGGAAPVPLFSRPCLLIACVLLAFLFATPRIALLMVERRKLWAVASVCHVIAALLLPLIFLVAVKDIRTATWRCFRCRDKSRDEKNGDKTSSTLALTNVAFLEF